MGCLVERVSEETWLLTSQDDAGTVGAGGGPQGLRALPSPHFKGLYCRQDRVLLGITRSPGRGGIVGVCPWNTTLPLSFLSS